MNCVYVVFLLFPSCLCVEPVSTAVGIVGAVIVSGLYATWDYTKCKRQECCDDSWVKLNYSGLISTLMRSLHGQHLVERIVPRAVKGQFQNKKPKKALVMAFHGWTGSGKNFVSKIIAEHLYVKGMKSEFVHQYIATQHFPHKSKVLKYRDHLQEDIRKATKQCGRSLFIFDEMDKMPAGVVDAIKPYIDYHDEIDGIDYKKNIFIFLSNAGGNEIARVSFNFWLDGKEREEILMKDIEPIINKGAFNEDGGLQNSEIIKRSLIDLYIPFLPLEKKHVQMCIRDELISRFQLASQDTIEKVADQLEYYPPDFYVYSASGCKKIAQKIDIYADEDDEIL